MTSVVALQDIILDQDVQARFVVDEDRVTLFANLCREDSELGDPRLPPVTLIQTSDGKLILADGFTRVEATRRIGLEFIQASIQPGTKADAILASIKENAAHGLPLTLAERRRAAERLLGDPEWGKESDRELGRRCGLDNKTVAKLRAGRAPATRGKKRTVRRRGQVYEMGVSPVRAIPASRAADIPKPSEEIPQTTDAPTPHRPSKQKCKTARPTSTNVPAGSGRDERCLLQLADLSRQWAQVKAQLKIFMDQFDAADPLVRERFLKDTPAAAHASSILPDRAGGAERAAKPGAPRAAET